MKKGLNAITNSTRDLWYKVNEKYRWRFVIKGKNNKPTRSMLAYLIREMMSMKGFKCSVSVDINPNNL